MRPQPSKNQILMWVVKDLERSPSSGAQLQGRQWRGAPLPMGTRTLSRRMTAVGTYREEDEAALGVAISEEDQRVIMRVSTWGGRAARRAALALAQTRNPERRRAHSATLRRLAPVSVPVRAARTSPAFLRARKNRALHAA